MKKDRGQVLEWVAFASNAFNVMVPFYTTIDKTPDYLSSTTKTVSTDSFYWVSRLIAALSDAAYGKNIMHIERYQESVGAKAHALVKKYDAMLEQKNDEEEIKRLCEKANEEMADMVRLECEKVLEKVLSEASNSMKNGYVRSDN